MKNKRSNKNSKIKSFLFFLLLAIVFWGLTKLSRQYTSAAMAKIEYVHIPDGIEVDDNNPKVISFEMTANGFAFLMYKLTEPSLKIDIGSFYTEGDEKITIREEQLILLLTAGMKKNLSISALSKNELSITLSKIVSRTVPIIGNTNFTFKEGYGTRDSLKLQPDSIRVFGPSSIVNKINAINTKLISKADIEDDISITVPLVLPDNKKISLEANEVLLELKVTEFTQMQLAVPIEVVNVPSDLTVKIIPEVTQISFIISVDDFNTISATDFKLICDYSERDTSNNSMRPKLIRQPKYISKVEFLDRSIDFLIFK
ncbi:MAG: YbbR-like domain-containing protein [Altibacter sp.]|uniref:YbbR-like domain-containing protein n=1 Tax=Altibacter sp. TaxID=2024823 RepID=UPI001D91B114|nr:YbbR-like domain-containing protein [Altibacter sp.]MBZ0326464.1 YbbR-like domain-containing protein [Altibacter sp.]